MDKGILGPCIIACGSIIAAIITVFFGAGRERDTEKKQWVFFRYLNPVFILFFFLLAAIIYLAFPSVPTPYPKKDGLVADFSTGPGGPPKNALGETFGIILDSEYNGDSRCWYKLAWEEDNGKPNGFLKLYYQLIPRNVPDAEAYIGVYTDFSYPPPKTYDISNFTALSFRLRTSSPPPNGVKIFVTLASSNIPPLPGTYDFPEYNIPMVAVTDTWQNITVPLNSFVAPTFSSRKDVIKLDKTKVFRLSISAKSKSTTITHGYLDIDDIRFE